MIINNLSSMGNINTHNQQKEKDEDVSAIIVNVLKQDFGPTDPVTSILDKDVQKCRDYYLFNKGNNIDPKPKMRGQWKKFNNPVLDSRNSIFVLTGEYKRTVQKLKFDSVTLKVELLSISPQKREEITMDKNGKIEKEIFN